MDDRIVVLNLQFSHHSSSRDLSIAAGAELNLAPALHFEISNFKYEIPNVVILFSISLRLTNDGGFACRYFSDHTGENS